MAACDVDMPGRTKIGNIAAPQSRGLRKLLAIHIWIVRATHDKAWEGEPPSRKNAKADDAGMHRLNAIEMGRRNEKRSLDLGGEGP